MKHGVRTLGRALLLVALTLSACGGKSDAEMLASATQYLAKGDAKAASIQLKNVLQKKPSHAQARFLLGRALFELGDARGAELELVKALDLGQAEEQVAPLMARVLLATHQYQKLTLRYATLELTDPAAAAELAASMATAYAAQGAFDDARTAVTKALAADPGSTAVRLVQARVAAASGDTDAALKLLDDLLAGVPGHAEAWQLKGDLVLRAKADRPGAIDAYRKALAIDPKLAVVHAALVTLYLQQPDLDAAARQHDELKKIAPRQGRTLFLEAQVAFARKEFKHAHDVLQGLIQSAPNDVAVLYLGGATELQLDALAQAETLLSRAVAQAPDFAGARRLLGATYLRSDQAAKALATLRPTLDGGHADGPTLALAAQAASRAGDAKAAQSYLAQAAKAAPGDTRIRAAQALTQVAGGHAEAALADLQSLAADDSGISADLALIFARLQSRDLTGALKAIDAIERKQPASPIAANLRGRVLLQRRDVAAARQSFEQALAKDPKFYPAVASLAGLDVLDDKPEEARARFEALLKLDPKNLRALLALAELKARSGGSHDEVTRLIDAAVKANPGSALPRIALIDHHLAGKDLKAALAAAQAAAVALPASVELIDKLGRTQLAAGSAEQAITSFGKITSMRADSPVGYVGLGEAQLAAQDAESASKNFKRALELAPESPAAQRGAIGAALQLKRPQQALAVARDIQTRHAEAARGFVVEGDIEITQKHWEPAIAALRKALTKADPAQAPARLHFALVQAARAADAARFADGWVKDHPNDALFLFYLGDVALSQNNLALAQQRYEAVLKLQPGHALALNNTAWLLARQNKPGAVALAERAVKAAPGQPALLDTLALALAGENQLARAIEVQKTVVARAPTVPAFRLNLARLYLQSGAKALARPELEKLARLGPDFAGQDEVARLLASAGSR